jgi:hypothetical protein
MEREAAPRRQFAERTCRIFQEPHRETGGQTRRAARIPEQNRIALVYDNIDPAIPAFSLDATVASWSAGNWQFTPQPTGFVNRDFPSVIPGAIYCFDGMRWSGVESGSVLVEVFGVGGESADRLRIERQGAPSCGTGPWTFTAAASVYLR